MKKYEPELVNKQSSKFELKIETWSFQLIVSVAKWKEVFMVEIFTTVLKPHLKTIAMKKVSADQFLRYDLLPLMARSQH